jgi:hypothetical protein
MTHWYRLLRKLVCTNDSVYLSCFITIIDTLWMKNFMFKTMAYKSLYFAFIFLVEIKSYLFNGIYHSKCIRKLDYTLKSNRIEDLELHNRIRNIISDKLSDYFSDQDSELVYDHPNNTLITQTDHESSYTTVNAVSSLRCYYESKPQQKIFIKYDSNSNSDSVQFQPLRYEHFGMEAFRKYFPSLLPRLLHYDEPNQIMVYEYLYDHRPLRDKIAQGLLWYEVFSSSNVNYSCVRCIWYRLFTFNGNNFRWWMHLIDYNILYYNGAYYPCTSLIWVFER